MKLIVLYGPPASGKLTIANSIARKSSYKVFDNHMTTDFINSLFQDLIVDTWPLIEKYRLELIKDAAKNNIPGLVFTYFYESTERDKKFIEKIIDLCEKFKIELHFIKIECDNEVLIKRVGNDSRQIKKKIKDKSKLLKILKNIKEPQQINYSNHKIIQNNASDKADEVSELILKITTRE